MQLPRFSINIPEAIRVCYYVLFFTTPLLFSLKTSEIFEFNKMILIYLVTIVIATLYGLQLVFSQNRKIFLNRFYILLSLFLVSQILSTIFSIDVHTSFFGYYSRWNGGLISIISYLLLFFVFVQIMEKKHIEKLLIVSLIASCLVILWGLPGKLGADPTCFVYLHKFTNSCWTENFDPATRMFSTLGQPNWLGAYMAAHFFIGVYFLLKNLLVDSRLRGNDYKAIIKYLMRRMMKPHTLKYVIYLALIILTIIFTQSRSSQLALLVAFMLGVIIATFKFDRLRRWMMIAVIGLISVISLIGFVKKDTIRDFFLLPAQQSTITDSFDIRKIVWKGAIDLGNKYPRFGSGAETFAYAYYFTRPAAHNLTSEWDFIYNKAHNEYLNYLATTGYVGLSAYLLMIVGTIILFYFSFKDKKNENQDIWILLSLFLSYITILITNFFGFSISIIQLFFYLIPACLIVYLGKRVNYEVSLDVKVWQKSNLQKKLILLLVTFMGFTGGLYVYRYYIADMQYAKAQEYLALDDYSQATEELYKALGNRYEHVYEDKLSSALASMAFVQSFGSDDKAVRNIITFSKNHNLNTLKQSPYNIIYLRTQAKNYYLYYQVTNDIVDLQKSIDASEKVIKIAPTDAQSYYQLALYYWIAGNETKEKDGYLTKANETIIQSLNLRPNYIEAKELLGELP